MAEQGVVVAVENGRAIVRFERNSMCKKCGMCGKAKEARLSAACAEPVSPGEEVCVELPESRLLLASLMAYILPLSLLMIGLLATRGLGSDLLSAGVGLGLMAIGFVAMRLIDPIVKRSRFFEPRVSSVIKN